MNRDYYTKNIHNFPNRANTKYPSPYGLIVPRAKMKLATNVNIYLPKDHSDFVDFLVSSEAITIGAIQLASSDFADELDLKDKAERLTKPTRNVNKELLRNEIDHLNKCYPAMKFQIRDYSGSIRVVFLQGQSLVTSDNYRVTLSLLRAWVAGWNLAIDMDMKTPTHQYYRSR